jgi:glycosyltransferase involved in cell wall biosynthesis
MKITLGTTYYNNPENIIPFIERHLEYVDELIIVDDGSLDEYHILNYVQPCEKIRLYRVKYDYGFNSHGCRNLIMKESSNEFVVLADSDRIFIDPEYSFNTIKDISLNKNTLYRFIVYYLNFPPLESANDFLISKTHFFSVGGYDEELIGWRGGDDLFSRQLINFGNEENLYEIKLIMTRPASEYYASNKNVISKNDNSYFKRI